MFAGKTKIISVASALAICTGLSVTTVYAGAMPDAVPSEEMTPLDEALMDIQGIGTEAEAPVPLAPTEQIQEQIVVPVQAIEPVIEEKQPEPKHVQAAVPENRTVQVQPDSSFFGLSVGLYDAFTHNKVAASFNMEYQSGVRILGVLQPIFGAMITSQGTLFGYGGVGLPLDVTDRVFLTPSIAVGGYSEGDGYDLGETVAYRFGAELGWKLKNQSRISLNAHIITNGKSFDRADRTEVIGLAYTTPLQKFSK